MSGKSGQLLPETVEVVEGDVRRCKSCERWLATSRFKANEHTCHSCRGLRRYSITYREYRALLDSQGGCCAICGAPEPDDARLAVDHDHNHCDGNYSCGECVRGLLCIPCNLLVGDAKDRADVLRAAADYLERN